jgi:hypothetical protein
MDKRTTNLSYDRSGKPPTAMMPRTADIEHPSMTNSSQASLIVKGNHKPNFSSTQHLAVLLDS